MMKVKTRTHG